MKQTVNWKFSQSWRHKIMLQECCSIYRSRNNNFFPDFQTCETMIPKYSQGQRGKMQG